MNGRTSFGGADLWNKQKRETNRFESIDETFSLELERDVQERIPTPFV